MIVKKSFSIDLAKRNAAPIGDAVQGDSVRTLEVTLLEDSQPWPVPPSAQVFVRYRNALGGGGTYDSLPDNTPAWSVSDNVLTVHLVPQVLAVAGVVNIQIVITKEEDQLSTFAIQMLVQHETIGAQAPGDYMNLAQWLANHGGGITVETDPTIPDWAKQESKPTYTAEEVGAAEVVHYHNQYLEANHGGDRVKHITTEERTAWNSKANAEHHHDQYLPGNYFRRRNLFDGNYFVGVTIGGTVYNPTLKRADNRESHMLIAVSVKPNTKYTISKPAAVGAEDGEFRFRFATTFREDFTGDVADALEKGTQFLLSGGVKRWYTEEFTTEVITTGPSDKTLYIQVSKYQQPYVEILEGEFDGAQYETYKSCVDPDGINVYSKDEVDEAIQEAVNSGSISPVATVEQTDNGAVITITDKNGTTTATVTNGKDGARGATGNTGATGPVGITWRGTWSASSNYNTRDAVSYSGSSYYARTLPTKGLEPSRSSAWETIAQKGTNGTNGKTPVKGTDYWTDEDKAEIIADVLAALSANNG